MTLRWKKSELADMRAADAEIEAEFTLIAEELRESQKRDREAAFEALPPEKKAIAAKKREYYDANKKILFSAGSKIRDARKAHGYSQQVLAELIGMTQTAVSCMELGKVPPRYDLLVAVLPELEGLYGT